jgi:hypothetical protein
MSKEDVDDGNPVFAARKTLPGFAGRLGRHLGITRSAVWAWKRVPPKHAPAVAKFMKLKPHQVCPEIYPPPRKAKGETRLAVGDH